MKKTLRKKPKPKKLSSCKKSYKKNNYKKSNRRKSNRRKRLNRKSKKRGGSKLSGDATPFNMLPPPPSSTPAELNERLLIAKKAVADYKNYWEEYYKQTYPKVGEIPKNFYQSYGLNVADRLGWPSPVQPSLEQAARRVAKLEEVNPYPLIVQNPPLAQAPDVSSEPNVYHLPVGLLDD